MPAAKTRAPNARAPTRAAPAAAGRGSAPRGRDAAKRAWLEAPNVHLRWARPVERLADGDFDAVRAAAESYVVGDYV